jgi:hypothetical protein
MQPAVIARLPRLLAVACSSCRDVESSGRECSGSMHIGDMLFSGMEPDGNLVGACEDGVHVC